MHKNIKYEKIKKILQDIKNNKENLYKTKYHKNYICLTQVWLFFFYLRYYYTFFLL